MKVLAHVGSVVAQASLNNPGAQVQVVGLAGGAIGVTMGNNGAVPTLAGAPGIPNTRGGVARAGGMPQVVRVAGAMPVIMQQQQQRMMVMRNWDACALIAQGPGQE